MDHSHKELHAINQFFSVKLIPNGQTKPDHSKEFLNAEAGKVDDYVVKALREEYFWTKEPIYLDPIDF